MTPHIGRVTGVEQIIVGFIKILLAAGVGVLFFLAGGSIACELDKLDCGETIEESF